MILAALAVGGIPSAAQAGHGVAAGHLRVIQLDVGDTTNSVRVIPTLRINDFRLRDGSNRGDYPVQIGLAAADDVATGVLISSVAENGRYNFGTNNFPISAVHVGATDYRISTFVRTAAVADAGAEYNANVAAAWFPYDRFWGGTARNAAGLDGGTNNLLVASPGLVLGHHFKGVAAGRSVVDLRSFGIDARTDGVLLVNGGKDENNFALSQVNTNDGTWNVFVKDNATPTASQYEQDPVAFVFIPKTNTALISGRFNGDGSIALFSGAAPAFTVSNLAAGRWDLRIPGHSPRAGILIISAEGGGHYNLDNIVSYQINEAGNGWEIQSRDTPNNGLQTPVGSGGEPEAVCSFVFIPAAAPLLVSPANGAPNQALPQLQTVLFNAAPGDLTVTVYGGEAATPPAGPDFTVVVLPDSQNYTDERNGAKKEMWFAQCEWIITNRLSRNIAYVAHLGDISQTGDVKGGRPNLAEWRNATNAMYRLENRVRTELAEGVPYGLAVGNHDQTPRGDPLGTTIFYNQYFGISHFLGRTYYGGYYGTNNNNHYDLFSASGLDFIVLYFEYDMDANPAVLAWGNEVLQAYADRQAIVVTHYMGSATTPSTFSAQGAAIYNTLKGNPNLALLLGGHVAGPGGIGEGSREDHYGGNTVRTLISNYQFRTNGGNGMLRLMEFSPSNNTVVVQTYSPWSDEYETDEDSEFFFTRNLQPPGGTGSPGTPFTVLTTQTGVAPGSLVNLTWPGLRPDRTYQWYVTVTDAAGNTTVGETWRFTTVPNSPPRASNQLVTIEGDAPASLTLRGSDPNGDAITFGLFAPPSQGAITELNTNAGTLTYYPVRGYRGPDRFTYRAYDGRTNSSIATFNLIITAPADTNANGLPDAWEAAYGITDPDADDDRDGHSNRDEYRANTNPTNAASALRITGMTRQPDGHFDFAWASVGGTRYRVQFTDAPDPAGLAGGFTDVVRALTNEMDLGPYGIMSTQRFTDDFTLTGGAPTNQSRYYRVRVVP